MGVLDKIKNALFEVEYVEVDEKPKKEKKKSKDVSDDTEVEKPIAKKIVLPGRKEEKVEELQEEELKDEDFEIRPKDEKVKEVFSDTFNVMDDDDYKPEEVVVEETQPVVEEKVKEVHEEVQHAPIVAQVQSSPVAPTYQETPYSNKDYVKEYDSYKEKVYSTIHDDYRVKTRESKPYGMDPSYQVSIKEYGAENRDEKGYFKPSPIISPIYGILDKNYRKEDVVSKKEVRLSSSYSRANINVDDIRDKAYGKRYTEETTPEVETKPVAEVKQMPAAFEVEEEDENLLVDLTDEKKPEVKEITVGDAMEYYHDLGLEYNVDYVDASNKNPAKKKADDLEEDIKDTIDNSPEVEDEPVIERTMEIPQEELEPKEEVQEVKEEPVVEEKKEEVVEEESTTSDDDDNLFDLIDSMYKEEDN